MYIDTHTCPYTQTECATLMAVSVEVIITVELLTFFPITSWTGQEQTEIRTILNGLSILFFNVFFVVIVLMF